ncbi:hypothetical protein AMTR_s00084p00055530 [Amborella trichopoda]|uniref:Uncharacterized protein n=1 Tax=Amborella trichopoda TaxID=13333 RepID=W1P3S2_AMBTC|nr:hypothetical protein AMTR_s00084p00055530 [Amborella trichopoda]
MAIEGEKSHTESRGDGVRGEERPTTKRGATKVGARRREEYSRSGRMVVGAG